MHSGQVVKLGVIQSNVLIMIELQRNMDTCKIKFILHFFVCIRHVCFISNIIVESSIVRIQRWLTQIRYIKTNNPFSMINSNYLIIATCAALMIFGLVSSQYLQVVNASASDIETRIKQKFTQKGICKGDAECFNLGANEYSLSNIKKDVFALINQGLKQSNKCQDDALCSNEGYNQMSIGDMIKSKVKAKISQSLSQSNECKDSVCANEGYNEVKIGGDDDVKQELIQINKCSKGATCINSAGNVVLTGDKNHKDKPENG